MLSLLVLLVFLIKSADTQLVRACSLDVVLLLPIELTQMQQQRRLVRPGLLALFQALLPSIDTMGGIARTEVDVAHRIIDLIEVVFILIAASHTFQTRYHLAELALVHHLGLHDASVESHFVRRIGTNDTRKRLVSQGIAPRFVIELCQQEVEAGLRQLAACRLYSVLQVWNGFLVLMRQYIIASLRIVEVLLSMPRNTVSLHLVQQIFGIVWPFQCHIAARQSSPCHRSDVGLRAIETQDVVVRRSRLEELAFAELCIGHHEPGVVNIGIELLASQKLFFLIRTLLVTRGGGAFLDTVHLDGFLTFGDSGLEVALSHACSRLVGADIHGQYLVEVVLVTLVLGLSPFQESHLTVVEGIVVSRQSVVSTRSRCILLDRTRDQQDDQHDDTHHAEPLSL